MSYLIAIAIILLPAAVSAVRLVGMKRGVRCGTPVGRRIPISSIKAA